MKLFIFLSKRQMISTIQKSLRRGYTLALLLLMTSTSAEAYAKLAKDAGLSSYEMKKIIKKMVKTESTNGSYRAKNRKSGAYGRYQIMPKTAKYYAKKLHIPFGKWKEARNQDKIFKAILRDNIRSLKRNNIKVNAFTIYGTHQQGVNGFKAIIKNKKLTKGLERNIRHNLPKNLRLTSKNKLRKTWMRYWKKRFS